MVGLTNPRQRTRHHSYDFVVDQLPSSRSSSPHGFRRPRVRGANKSSGSNSNKRLSKLPLLGPPLIFMGLLWIGLQAGGPDNRMPIGVNDNRGSRLVVDPEEMMRHGSPVFGRLRGKTIDTRESPLVKNKGKEEIKGDAGKENAKLVIPAKEEEDDETFKEDGRRGAPSPPPESPDYTELKIVSTTTSSKPKNEKTPNISTQQADIVVAEATRPKSTAPPLDNVVSLYLEPRTTLDESTRPLPPRKTSADLLERIDYPNIRSCADIPHRLPVNHLPDKDPFIPWIHDYFVSSDGRAVQFVAANKRRCETGQGKETVMAYLQAQISLFQPLPVARVVSTSSNHSQNEEINQYRLASPDDPDLIAAETRFQCRFHRNPGEEWITFSQFSFNYEYVIWRKRGNKPMFVEMGPDVDQAELSQLLFSCPIPDELKTGQSSQSASFWVDVIPIRTPTRKNSVLLSANHTGFQYISQIRAFNASKNYGKQHILPSPSDSGRWANLPVCMPNEPMATSKPHALTACTWASASYRRRGDETFLFDDTAARLREWAHFHRLVGIDHIFVYDNTPLANTTTVGPLENLLGKEFADFVTFIQWPAQVCNNRKPKDKNPGERSSQYAAEASCLQRFGHLTDWMTFLDVDEYLIPTSHGDWKHVLAQHSKTDSILSLRSARGRPRVDLMQELTDTSVCDATKRHLRNRAEGTCLGPRSNETFLKLYSCDTFPPPRPESFVKNKKQIFRPSFVLQHFVNNSTVTVPLATYYQDTLSGNTTKTKFTRELPIPDLFIDEVSEGFLLHAKTVSPPETMLRSRACQTGSSAPCTVGYVCPASTARNETLQRKNGLRDETGKFCNCWVHPDVETRWVPRLEQALSA